MPILGLVRSGSWFLRQRSRPGGMRPAASGQVGARSRDQLCRAKERTRPKGGAAQTSTLEEPSIAIIFAPCSASSKPSPSGGHLRPPALTPPPRRCRIGGWSGRRNGPLIEQRSATKEKSEDGLLDGTHRIFGSDRSLMAGGRVKGTGRDHDAYFGHARLRGLSRQRSTPEGPRRMAARLRPRGRRRA